LVLNGELCRLLVEPVGIDPGHDIAVMLLKDEPRSGTSAGFEPQAGSQGVVARLFEGRFALPHNSALLPGNAPTLPSRLCPTGDRPRCG
jgi:hypothetical protein